MNCFNQFITRVSTLVLLLTLSACDGGLFGTGDGGPIVPVNAGTPPAGNGDMGAMEGGETPIASPTAPDTGLDTSSPQSFENLQISTRESDALVNVLNYSASGLVLSVDSSSTDSEIIASNTNSEVLSIAPTTSVLSLLDSDEMTLATFNPFTVASQSLSTIFVREAVDGIDAIAVTTETSTDDAVIARVRIVQIGSLGDTSLSGDVELQSFGTNPGPSSIQFPAINFATNPVTDYAMAGSGDYLLVDSLNRIDPLQLTLDGGTVYTILLVGNTDITSVVVINDSGLINQQ